MERVVNSLRTGDDVGRIIVEEANRLKGLVRKIAQLMGDRSDLVESETIRMHLRSLQSDCDRRMEEDIKQDMNKLPGYLLEFVKIEKAGTIGEVSKVRDPTGREYAMKTINPQSKRLYEQDLNLFNSKLLRLVKAIVVRAPLPTDMLKQVKAGMENLFNSLLNTEFQQNIMGEFSLAREKCNLNAGEAAASRLVDSSVRLRVPSAMAVSEDGTVLLMEWIPGLNISDYVNSRTHLPVESVPHPPCARVQQDLFRALVGYYFRDLLVRKRLHRDLHPGNLIIQDSSAPVQVYILDIGSEIVPRDDHIPVMKDLLRHIHCDPSRDCADYRRMWEELGVTSSQPGDAEQFKYISNSFDIIQGTAGLNLKENTVKTKFLTLPAWVLLWQTATSAFVMTLQTLKRLPGSETVDVGEAVRDAVDQFCAC